ncbi:unnamed protein product [Protopolystoma xenopodis]|uniref:Uncharacterized protein n=1 Tax=Protopolystoma xenopodis TaxID=117903 RepID=A0A448WZE4_9PLAT|nr:unnamed protein product [Protopolystoma xenopodis]
MHAYPLYHPFYYQPHMRRLSGSPSTCERNPLGPLDFAPPAVPGTGASPLLVPGLDILMAHRATLSELNTPVKRRSVGGAAAAAAAAPEGLGAGLLRSRGRFSVSPGLPGLSGLLGMPVGLPQIFLSPDHAALQAAHEVFRRNSIVQPVVPE